MCAQTTFAQARQNAGLTRDEAARLLGVSDQMLRGIERGETLPDAVVLRNMVRAYGVSADTLLRGLAD